VDGECIAEECVGCCCLDGLPAGGLRDQEACEGAGGAWHVGVPCATYDIRCCEAFRVACRERVWSTYQKQYQLSVPNAFCDDCPIEDAGGDVVRVVGLGSQTKCAGDSAPIQESSEGDWSGVCDTSVPPDWQEGVSYDLPKFYDRWRIVDDCSECLDEGGDLCTPGVQLLGCVDLNDDESLRTGLAACDSVDLCANPLP
jgi:hypothetical protein